MVVKLEGVGALVTGCGHRGQVGRAVAASLKQHGARVCVTARTALQVQEAVAELGEGAVGWPADLVRQDEVQSLVQSAAAALGSLSIVVHCAGGLGVVAPFADQTLEQMRGELDRNLLSTWVLCRSIWPVLVRAGGGSIVTFGRHGAPGANLSGYLAAKAGVHALTEALAVEGAAYGIRANVVAPSMINTAQNRADLPDADAGRWASLAEIASAVLFLVSADASGVTGQVLAVPGRVTPT